MERKPRRPLLISLDQFKTGYPFGFRYDYQDKALESSLEKRGFLFPLLAAGGERERVTLISGHKRFFYAKKKGIKEIPAILIEENCSPKELFLLSLYSNWGQAFSDLDRMVAIQEAETRFGLSASELEGEILPALGLAESGGVLGNYKKAALLHPKVHERIRAGQLPFQGISSLGRWSKSEQETFCGSLFSRLHLTTNQLKLLSEWLWDLKKKNQASLEDLVGEGSIQDILRNENLDLRSRGEKVFERFRTLRFPTLSKQAKPLREIQRKLEAEGILLERRNGSEEGEILLHARLKKSESLARVIGILQAHQQAIGSLF